MDSATTKEFDLAALVSSLRQSSFLAELRDYVDYLVSQDDFSTAYQAQKHLALALVELDGLHVSNPALWLEYQRCLWRLRTVALPALSDELAIATLTEGLPMALAESEVDLVDKLEAKLVRIFMHEDRDKFKAELRQAMLAADTLLFQSGDQPAQSLGAWLKDYSAVVGATSVDPLKRQQYVNQGKLPGSLNSQQKDQLRELLALFDSLKLSSLTPEGLEDVMTFERDGRKLILNHGTVYEIGNDIPPALAPLFEEETPAVAQPTTRIPVASPVSPPLSAVSNFSGPVALVREPSVFKNTTPAFLFDAQDEREADKFRVKNQELGIKNKETLEKQLRLFAEEVIKKNNLTFKEDANRRRFVNLFISRLKDVRSVVDVREVLGKPAEVGGLGMLGDTLEKVVGLIETAKLEFDERLSQGRLPAVVPDPELALPAGGRIMNYESRIMNQVAEVAQQTKPVPTPRTAPRPPITTQTTLNVQKAEAWRAQVLQELAQHAQATEPKASAPASRPQLVDVQAPPKVLGPLEELKTLSLTDFRRLSTTPTTSLKKVAAKIELMGETSVAKRLEAIRAWQASPIYQTYLRMGRASIEQGQPIVAVAAQRQGLGEPTLTEEEFNAVADFNAKLRF